MRTKTLLVACAALALGLATSQAQVYSANVVGYVNITVPAGQFALAANQLDTGSNTVDNVFPSGGVSSSTTMLLWQTSNYKYKTLNYYNSDDSPDGGTGWYDSGGNPATNTMSPGQGCFIYNPSAGALTFTTVGTVLQGTNSLPITSGLNLYSEMQPFSGVPLDSTNVSFPSVSSSTTYATWNPITKKYRTALNYYNSDDSPDGGTGWYNGAGNNVDNIASNWPAPGQAFLINHPGATTWVNKFTVQ